MWPGQHGYDSTPAAYYSRGSPQGSLGAFLVGDDVTLRYVVLWNWPAQGLRGGSFSLVIFGYFGGQLMVEGSLTFMM
jgi:hypothetical protein